MPIIAVFYGMVFKLYHSDHNPPHFHVEYGDQEIWVEIRTGRIIKGKIPKRLLRDVEEWRKLHKHELLKAWEDAQALRKIKRIKPLE